jgi:diguanylate cyclase (GGDEF)-like protein
MRFFVLRLARACLLGLACCAQLAWGAGAPVATHCERGASFASMQAAQHWNAYPDGRVVVTPQAPVCWVRLAPDSAGQLAFAGSWVDVTLFSADGAMLGQAQRGAAGSISLSTSEMLFFPALTPPPRFARVSLLSGWGMAAETTLLTADAAVQFGQSQRADSFNLAVVAFLLTSAFFLLVFSLVLRFLSYALLACFLFLTACARLLDHGQLFAFFAHGQWSWPLWAATWPLVNAALALTCTYIGRYRLHAPAMHRASWCMALLLLPLCLLWPFSPALADQLHAVLNVPLYLVLIAGSARGARSGDAACKVLLISNVLGAAVWFPAAAARFVDVSDVSYFASPLAAALAAAADLAIPLLLCVALARRQLALQRRSAALQEAAIADAGRDALTGLLNRDGLLRHGAALSATGASYSVVVLNVDRFRAINETLGGPIADLLLRAVAERLQSIAGAVAARLHADQFCLIWPGTGALDGLRERIAADSAQALTIDGQSVDLPLSAGVAWTEDAQLPTADLLRNAEIALDAARAQHAPWLVYHPALARTRRADLGLLSELDRAVSQGELRMFLQPKVRLQDGAVASAEALVRWEHPERGLVPPFEFVPFAVKTGRIARLTDWMLGEAMALTARLRAAGAPLQIAVNMSARDLTRPGLASQLAALLRTHGASAEDIRLEVTESEAMEDPASALAAMHALCAAGFSLSIDDFGTGHSSLVYLQKMPVAELKIDRAFVAGVTLGSDAAVLLGSTIELAHRLGLKVVAEGPETADEWAMVTELGCDFAQGWHAARAMDVAAFLRWRAQHAPFLSSPSSRLAVAGASDET